MVALMNALLDAAGDDENHAPTGLLDWVGDLAWKYEQEKHVIEPVEAKDTLRFLMEARRPGGHRPQSNLSAILAGKRKISATLASKLGKFFGVSPAVFVPA